MKKCYQLTFGVTLVICLFSEIAGLTRVENWSNRRRDLAVHSHGASVLQNPHPSDWNPPRAGNQWIAGHYQQATNNNSSSTHARSTQYPHHLAAQNPWLRNNNNQTKHRPQQLVGVAYQHGQQQPTWVTTPRANQQNSLWNRNNQSAYYPAQANGSYNSNWQQPRPNIVATTPSGYGQNNWQNPQQHPAGLRPQNQTNVLAWGQNPVGNVGWSPFQRGNGVYTGNVNNTGNVVNPGNAYNSGWNAGSTNNNAYNPGTPQTLQNKNSLGVDWNAGQNMGGGSALLAPTGYNSSGNNGDKTGVFGSGYGLAGAPLAPLAGTGNAANHLNAAGGQAGLSYANGQQSTTSGIGGQQLPVRTGSSNPYANLFH